MIDPSLEEYLKKAHAAGASSEKILTELEVVGWSSNAIEEAKAWLATQNTTNAETVPAPPESSINQAPQPQVLSLSTTDIKIESQLPPLATKTPGGVPLPPIHAITVPPTLEIEEHEQKKSHTGLIVGILLSVFIFLVVMFVGGAGTYAYLLAADKVAVDNEFLENTADLIALKVPFFPKTAKIVLARAAMSHQSVTQSSLDFSLVATSNDFTDMIGGNEMDIVIKGYTDVVDPKNPKFDLSGSITKDFSFDLKKSDPVLYYRITKVPTILLAIMGLTRESVQPLLNKWVSYDTTPLESEARKTLDTLDTENQTEDDAMVALSEELLKDDILPTLEMEKEELEGVDTYKITFKPSAALLDKLGAKINRGLSKTPSAEDQSLGVMTAEDISDMKVSDVVKNLILTLWVDSNEYLIRKTTFSMDMQPPSSASTLGASLNLPALSSAENDKVTLVAALKLSNFGETVPIESPSNAISQDQFYEEIGKIVYGQMMTQQSLEQGMVEPSYQPYQE